MVNHSYLLFSAYLYLFTVKSFWRKTYAKKHLLNNKCDAYGWNVPKRIPWDHDEHQCGSLLMKRYDGQVV